jgi:hypothetical protein
LNTHVNKLSATSEFGKILLGSEAAI